MDFHDTAQEESVRAGVAQICSAYGDDYWLERDRKGGFPDDFYQDFAKGGWLGICIPEAYGGSGLGVAEAAVMMRTIAESGAGMSGGSAVHINVFGLNPVVVFGTEEQKQRMLPPMVRGEDKTCFGVTEPNTGLNTTQLKLRAERRGDRYLVTARRCGSPPPRWPTRSCSWPAPRPWRR